MEINGIIFMLKDDNRLRGKKNFKRIFEKGKALKGNFLILRFALNDEEKIRFAILVSKKVSKKAVVRNKVKRKIKAIVLQNIPKLKKGFDFIFIVLPSFENKNFSEMEDEINKIFKNAHLYA